MLRLIKNVPGVDPENEWELNRKVSERIHSLELTVFPMVFRIVVHIHTDLIPQTRRLLVVGVHGEEPRGMSLPVPMQDAERVTEQIVSAALLICGLPRERLKVVDLDLEYKTTSKERSA